MRRRAIRLRWGWLVLAAVLLLLAAAGVEAYPTYRAATDLRAAASELRTMAGEDPAALDAEAAIELVRRANLDAQALQAQARLLHPLTRRLGWVPNIGPTLAASAPLADYVAGLTEAADELLTGLAPLLITDDAVPTLTESSLSARLVEVLIAAGPGLEAAEASLKRAEEARSQFDPTILPASLRDDVADADRLLPLAQEGVAVLRMLPSLLGAEAPRTYLLVAQNRDELRATGGYLTGIGTVMIDGGRIHSLAIGDSSVVDDLSKIYPLPPEPLQRYMLAGQWLVRDANWSPDFPTAAAKIQELYTFSTDVKTDGLITFDLAAVARLLGVTGPVHVTGVSEPIGADNVENYIHSAWAPAPGQGMTREWREHRKDFMGELGAAMMAAIQGSSDREMLLALARQTLALMREKHVLLAVDDPRAAPLLSTMGLDGALHPGPGDFLMLVDSNVGFNKVDQSIERNVGYTVDLRDPSTARVEVNVRYRHTVDTPVVCVHQTSYGSEVYEDLQNRCYWDFVRVYAPGGASLLGGSLPPTPGAYLMGGVGEPGTWTLAAGERGTSVFSGIFVLPTGSAADLRLEYSLPPRVLSLHPDGTRVYSLTISKQPGTEAVPVQVSALLPLNARILDAAGWTTVTPERLSWQGKLRTDISLSFTLAP